LKVVIAEDFSRCSDPVQTEENVSAQMIREADRINSEYIYISLPLAWNINHNGLAHTQTLIDNICRDYPNEKLCFVCQHILADRLSFHGNLVFTPHATVLDSFIPIPHYSCNYNQRLARPWEEREYTFSFMGSFATHSVRSKIYDYLKDRKDCLVINTGGWHFEGNQEKQEINSKKYSEVLGNTKYSLCPRGTGPSTIRIWESMAMGSKPIIFSDFLQMPLDREFHTSWIRMPENFDVSMLDAVAKDEKYDNAQYFEMFANDRLYKSIVRNL